jgi:hypothetical protein
VEPSCLRPARSCTPPRERSQKRQESPLGVTHELSDSPARREHHEKDTPSPECQCNEDKKRPAHRNRSPKNREQRERRERQLPAIEVPHDVKLELLALGKRSSCEPPEVRHVSADRVSQGEENRENGSGEQDSIHVPHYTVGPASLPVKARLGTAPFASARAAWVLARHVPPAGTVSARETAMTGTGRHRSEPRRRSLTSGDMARPA